LRTARLGVATALLALGSQLLGCGLFALMHDSMIGPVSPAGRIHDAVVGRSFEATFQGVSGDAGGEALFRPFPRDIIYRMGSPSSLQKLTTGLEAFLFGTSTYAERRAVTGATPDLARVPAAGASADDVLRALGPPDRWARFAGGETMAYRAERERWTTLNVGIPPAIGFLIPIPGASSLAYRRITKDQRSEGFVLFFDENRRLQRIAPAVAQ